MFWSPLPLPERPRKRTLVFITHLWVAKGLNVAMADPRAPTLPKHSWQGLYDGTLMRNVFQYAAKYGKAINLHPTKHHQNKKSKLACDMLCQKLGQNQENKHRRKKHISYLICPRVVESIQAQSSQPFEGVIKLTLICTCIWGCQQIHLQLPQRWNASWDMQGSRYHSGANFFHER